MNFSARIRLYISERSGSNQKYYQAYKSYKRYTMISRHTYINNLLLVNKYKGIDGAVVECGTWRGGMIAGIASLFDDDRNFYLYDSFEGLPTVKDIDGEAAAKWQNNKEAAGYYNNCSAEIHYAKEAMELTSKKNVFIYKGWFSSTLPAFPSNEKIAILRLDADWYDSTMDCLHYLYDKVVTGGIIILDDYYTWDGCSRALHDFLSKRKLSDRIKQWNNDNIAYMIKKGVEFSRNE